jgi:ABC-type uncharacterized transport system ATPase subunit
MPSTVLQSRLTKEKMFVECDYDWDGKALTVSRGTKEGLSITVDGIKKTGSNKLLEEELDKILAIPRELFRRMFHKRQFARGFFLSMTPKETYEFLTSCLGLEKEKKKVEEREKIIKELTEQKESFEKILEVQKQGKVATEDAMVNIGFAPVKDMHEEVLAALKEKLGLSSIHYQAVETRHTNELTELKKTKPVYKSVPYIGQSYQSVPFDRATLSKCDVAAKALNEKIALSTKLERDRQTAVNKAISDVREAKSAHLGKIVDADRARTDIEAKSREIETIRQSLCPTCEQNWATQKAKDRETKLIGEVTSLKGVMAAGIDAKAAIDAANKRIEELTLEAQPRKAQDMIEAESSWLRLAGIMNAENEKEVIHKATQYQAQAAHDADQAAKSKAHNDTISAENHAIMAVYTAKEDALRAQHKTELTLAAGQVDVDNRTFTAADEKFRAYMSAKTSHEITIKRMKDQHEVYKKAVDTLETEINKTTHKLIMETESRRALKSFISCSFDDALNTISNMATELIRHIPVMANSTIQLEGLRETQDGKVKEEINAVINMDGEEDIPIKSLCGGEETSAHLAVDLSVIDLIEQRTAKGINIFILDEPFTGMDTVCIEMALEVLKNSNTKKKLIIVDHNPEVKQMVQSRLVVVREGYTSNIVQV